jgi:hypothetical protein
MNRCPVCKGTGQLPEGIDKLTLKSSVKFKRRELLDLEEVLIAIQDMEVIEPKKAARLLARLYRPNNVMFNSF